MPHHHASQTTPAAIGGRLVRAGRRWAASAGAVPRPLAAGSPAVPADDGTPRSTVDATIQRTTSDRYTRLVWGPGEPYLVRTDLGVGAAADRAQARRSLLYFAHHTDAHVCDAQSPARLEPGERFAWVNPGADSGHRPQEACTTQVLDQMVRATNAVTTSALTGAAMTFCVQTGDSTDNRTTAEMGWLLDVLGGRPVTPDTGIPGRYEGIQRSGVGWVWHPDDPSHDRYGRAGFPRLPGFLDAAVRRFEPAGLDVPWLAVMGNHDTVFQGTFGPMRGLRFDRVGRMLVGARRKPVGVTGMLRALAHATVLGDDTGRWDRWGRGPGTVLVTADPAARQPLELGEWLQAMIDDDPPRHRPPSGAADGPAVGGHGFAAAHVGDGTAWWSRPHGDTVQLVGLDSCNHTRGSEGALSAAQLRWLEAELRRHHTRHRDEHGAWVTGPGPDRLCVLFSHHSSWTMTNGQADDRFPGPRHLGDEVVALLHRFPNVVLWVNGHSHEHRIVAHPAPASSSAGADADGPAGGYWEVNTASCIDFGQQARTLELVDNGDGTLSVFTTVLDHAAPPSISTTAPGGWSPVELASMSRELAANDATWIDPFTLLGQAEDRNTELVLAWPFRSKTA